MDSSCENITCCLDGLSAHQDIKFRHKLVVVASRTSAHPRKPIDIRTYLHGHPTLARFSFCLPSIPKLFYWL